MNDLLWGLATVAAFVVWWAYRMAIEAREPHVRTAENCIMYSPQRDWRGDPVPPEGECTNLKCIGRIG